MNEQVLKQQKAEEKYDRKVLVHILKLLREEGLLSVKEEARVCSILMQEESWCRVSEEVYEEDACISPVGRSTV